MTGQEMQARIRTQPFQPFRINMDNGQTFEVRHPELVLIAETGALYLFQPGRSDIADVVGPAAVCEMRNISTIEPLPRQRA